MQGSRLHSCPLQTPAISKRAMAFSLPLRRQQLLSGHRQAPSTRRCRSLAQTGLNITGGDDGLVDPKPQFLEGISGWRRRWTMVLLCFVAFMLCNMDRVNMSIAVLPMAAQYGWSTQTVGLVQSSFFWGYLLTQVLGGIWADRFGGKLVLGLGVVWWSMATAFTPIAAQMGLPALLAARALMGIGEGVAMPAMNNLLSRWVPVAERSRSLSLVYSGMFIGSIAGLALSPGLIGALGWPSVFYGFGSLGVLWYGLWSSKAASTPSEDPLCSNAEKAYILANTSVSGKSTRSIPWGKLLSRKEVWAIIVCHFCHNWGTFILLTWMPTYYNQVLGCDIFKSGIFSVLGCDIFKSGIFSVLPWMTMAISANVGGWIADTLVQRGTSVTAVRKIMQTLGFLGPAFCLTQLQNVSTLPAAVACMMGAQGFDAFSQSGLYSNHQDIGPRYAGVLLGLSNTAGVLAGVLGSLATGYLLAHGTWADVWRVAVILYLVGTVIWNLFATGERIFD
ncbi:hypothetical protein OEZ85_003155 [Tetradesmus obliquus]|uniref:Major facilitator superfamily (MFS) profile domain-containing protein n=1 Tax=Tetradesmus obliquus TaxID=3088 RepID=A0ABY8TZR4_TETOB|nr:hypothetical protein OEZ85_003155 [Tetradesmus obliquus]WIA14653.1 hypothetical protein OEZ85_003155 [Tetradesmus obliquus]